MITTDLQINDSFLMNTLNHCFVKSPLESFQRYWRCRSTYLHAAGPSFFEQLVNRVVWRWNTFHPLSQIRIGKFSICSLTPPVLVEPTNLLRYLYFQLEFDFSEVFHTTPKIVLPTVSPENDSSCNESWNFDGTTSFDNRKKPYWLRLWAWLVASELFIVVLVDAQSKYRTNLPHSVSDRHAQHHLYVRDGTGSATAFARTISD